MEHFYRAKFLVPRNLWVAIDMGVAASTIGMMSFCGLWITRSPLFYDGVSAQQLPSRALREPTCWHVTGGNHEVSIANAEVGQSHRILLTRQAVEQMGGKSR